MHRLVDICVRQYLNRERTHIFYEILSGVCEQKKKKSEDHYYVVKDQIFYS